MTDNFADSKAHVVVHKYTERAGNLMYVIFKKRAAFDLIDLPMTDHGPRPLGHVLSKNIDHDGQYIVFQYWIEKPKP